MTINPTADQLQAVAALAVDTKATGATLPFALAHRDAGLERASLVRCVPGHVAAPATIG